MTATLAFGDARVAGRKVNTGLSLTEDSSLLARLLLRLCRFGLASDDWGESVSCVALREEATGAEEATGTEGAVDRYPVFGSCFSADIC